MVGRTVELSHASSGTAASLIHPGLPGRSRWTFSHAKARRRIHARSRRALAPSRRLGRTPQTSHQATGNTKCRRGRRRAGNLSRDRRCESWAHHVFVPRTVGAAEAIQAVARVHHALPARRAPLGARGARHPWRIEPQQQQHPHPPYPQPLPPPPRSRSHTCAGGPTRRAGTPRGRRRDGGGEVAFNHCRPVIASCVVDPAALLLSASCRCLLESKQLQLRRCAI